MIPDRFRWTPGTLAFIAAASALNALLYHLPLLRLALHNLDATTAGGALTLATLLFALLAATALALTLVALASHRLLKPLCMLLALGNAAALYFLVTYGVVLDKAMMGNVRDTTLAESLELLHPTLAVYLLLLGGVPCLLLARLQLRPTPRPRLVAAAFSILAAAIGWAYLAAGTWLWFDRHAKAVGGRVLPWSYLVNAARDEARRWNPREPVPLPDASFASDERIVVVLVIGEAARAGNLQLYGYPRATTPLLARAGAVALRNPTACSTYTTASLRCILADVDAGSELAGPREPLPAYLQRHGVDVIWRTRNWGQPPMQLRTFERARELRGSCVGDGCGYDEVLLTGLAGRIRASAQPRTFVVLHLMGSHGPAYAERYPPGFERFAPACKSVELSRCRGEELVNAYDNTILYTDHVLSRAIEMLRGLDGTPSLLIYVSDHGESLGEHGLYLHGTPRAIAPDEQKQVPLILWMSPEFARLRGVDADRLAAQPAHSQRDVFHTVMGAFGMRSAAYAPEYDVLSESFAGP